MLVKMILSLFVRFQDMLGKEFNQIQRLHGFANSKMNAANMPMENMFSLQQNLRLRVKMIRKNMKKLVALRDV
jgi:hypothetical protein